MREVYGEKHSSVASTLNNLGAAWKGLGETKKAIDYFRQAHDINLKFFGPEHPSSKLTAEWLAKL